MFSKIKNELLFAGVIKNSNGKVSKDILEDNRKSAIFWAAIQLIFWSFSLIMSMVWMAFQSPDLAITEAAVGAGVTTLLFFGCFKKIGAIKDEEVDSMDEMEVDTVSGYEPYYLGDMLMYHISEEAAHEEQSGDTKKGGEKK